MSKSLIQRSNGVCVIFEGRCTSTCKEEGYPYEVSSIVLLDDILKAANANSLNVYYVTVRNGVSFADDIVQGFRSSYYKLPVDIRRKWEQVVAEELARKCIQHQTSRIYLMSNHRYDGSYDVSKLLKMRGLNVYMPILGLTNNKAQEALRRLVVW